MTTSVSRRFFVPVVVAVLVTVVIVLSTVADGSRATAATPIDASDAYARLAQPPNSSDRQTGIIDQAAAFDPQLEVGRARVLDARSAGTVWLVPRGDALCLGWQPAHGDLKFGVACAEIGRATSEGIGAVAGGHQLLVVPDDAADVGVITSSGSRRAIQAANNVVWLDSQDAQVTYRTKSGEQSYDVPDVATPRG